MNRYAIALCLALLAATTALAQVPRTINYQGRIDDGTAPITGNRQMTLRIYSAATGGAPIYEETQTVSFKSGVFTVAIGGGTPGGIPATIAFDAQYWLGVVITGFNGGNELTPRFILRSSPYSLRAAVADSASISNLAVRAAQANRAQRADTAGIAITLQAPATITGTKPAAALRVVGQPVAIVSEGIDSVTGHIVVVDTAGSGGTPVGGGYYRDNAPMAWGLVQRDGTLSADFGITSVTWQASTAAYEVTLDRAATTARVVDVDVPQLVPVITVGGVGVDPGSADAVPTYVVWSFKRLVSGNGYDPKVILVRFYSIVSFGQGQTTQRPFSISIMGRPQ